MSAGILIDNQIDIPPGIDSLKNFRRWVHSDDFPDEGRINWIRGKLEIEISADNILWHTSPKSVISGSLHARVKASDLGLLLFDKTRIVISQVDLACEPDLVFVSHESISAGHVRLIPTIDQEPDSYLEMEGPPDMVLEVVSGSSIAKDTQRLFRDYYEGGVREYWLADARGAELSFQIYARSDTRFVPAPRDVDDFQHSSVFNNWYRITRVRGQNDLWRYDLAERD